MSFARIFGAGMLAFALLLSGCRGGPEPTVRYSGTVLIVEGATYARRTPAEIGLPGDIAKGVVYVREKQGQRLALGARLDELGLTKRRYDDVLHFAVQVPLGWEDQWVRALLADPKVQDAWLDFGIPCC